MNNQKLFFTTVFLIVLIASLPLASAYSLTYDANGNLVSGDGKFRTYDGFNHLVEVRNGTDAFGQMLEQYEWHPTEDRIVAKHVYENGTWKETVIYASKTFVMVKNATGEFKYKYIYQNGQLVAQENMNTSEKLFFHNDNLGSVGLVTNESGAKVEETFYEPFGKVISGGATSRFDYTGKEYDSVTGDYDFNARKLSINPPGFTTPDSNIQNIFEPKDLNHYSYVRNNPYIAIDPTGKVVVYIGAGAMFGIGPGASASSGLAISYSRQEGFQVGFYTRQGSGGISPTISAAAELGVSPLQTGLNEFAGVTKEAGGDVGMFTTIGGGVSAPYNQEEDKLKLKKGALQITFTPITDINLPIPGSGYITQSSTTVTTLYSSRGYIGGSSGSARTPNHVAQRQVQEAESVGGTGTWQSTSNGGATFTTITPIQRTPGRGICLSCRG